MRKQTMVALLGAILLMGGTRIAQADISWTRSISEAQRRARAERKPVMIDCFTTWCGWCKKLDADTFKDPQVGQISQSFVALKIDAEAEGAGIAKQFEVTGFPTILFLSADGNLLLRIPGYVDGPTMAEAMQQVLKAAGSQPAATAPATSLAPAPATATTTQPAPNRARNTAVTTTPTVNQRALSKQQVQAIASANKFPKKPGGAVLAEDKENTLVTDSDGVFMVVDAPPVKPKAKAKKPVAAKAKKKG